MAKTISISHKSALGLDKTREALQTALIGLKERYSVEGHWKSEKLLVLSGPGIEGSVSLLEDATVEISISLGVAIMMFSAVIENEIRGQLKNKLRGLSRESPRDGI